MEKDGKYMMTNRQMTLLGSALLLLGLTTTTTPSAQAQGKVVQPDFQDWLSAQTTQFGLINNPDINGDGTADGYPYRVRFDYLKLTMPSQGTISGTVTVRPTVDGREDVTVNIEFEDVLLRVYRREGPSPGILVFGSEPAAIMANGALPALASGKYTLNFLQDAGAPFVNHLQVLNRGDWYASSLTLHGVGLFTADFDPEIAAGTPGFLRWGKPFRTPPANENADNGAYSQFPNDEFHLFPIGRR